ncbi:MAG: DUF2703 domain-containing protein [Phycisphaerae bacterium]|nr:DUF2703 domain-containing protein [Phycisphaerae bacterium]
MWLGALVASTACGCGGPARDASSACGCEAPSAAKSTAPRAVVIRWQRIADTQGQTCGRCGSTEQAIDAAAARLRQSLSPLEVTVSVQKVAMPTSDLDKCVEESNRIWLNDRPLEQWLSANVGTSACTGFCGDRTCRTLEVDGQSYDTIPADLIVRAGLLAAADSIRRPAQATCCGG